MCKKAIFLIIICVIISCEKKEKDKPLSKPKFSDHTSFTNTHIAVIEGSPGFETVITLNAVPIFYNDTILATEHVRLSSVSGFLHFYSTVNYISALSGNEDMKVIQIPENIYTTSYGAISSDETIIDNFNKYLEEIRINGIYKNIWDRWFDITRDSDAFLPSFTSLGGNGNFTVAICSDSAPFTYIGKDGVYTGFSIDLLLSYAARLEKKVQFFDINLDGILLFIENKKADFGIANIPIIQNKNRSFFYSDPIYEDTQGILVLRSNTEIYDNISVQDGKGI